MRKWNEGTGKLKADSRATFTRKTPTLASNSPSSSIRSVRDLHWAIYLGAGFGIAVALLVLGTLLFGAGHGSVLPGNAVTGPYFAGTLAWPVLTLAMRFSRRPLVGLVAVGMLCAIWYSVFWAYTEDPARLSGFLRLCRKNPLFDALVFLQAVLFLGGQVAGIWFVATGWVWWWKNRAKA